MIITFSILCFKLFYYYSSCFYIKAKFYFLSFAKGGEKFTKMKRNERNGKAKWYGKINNLYGIANINDYEIAYIKGEHL